MDQSKARKKVLLSWSSGKDSAWSLHILRLQPEFEVVGLLTTIHEAADRVAMHEVRRELLQAQAEAVGLPLIGVMIPWPCSNSVYEATMLTAVNRARSEGVTHMAFGDLFLEDIRQYRISKLANTGLEPIFPIWGLATDTLACDMIAAGLKARLTCVNPKALSRDFVGRDFDSNFLRQIPESVDPCGERGEFHSFAYDGPMFAQPLAIRTGEIIERDGFVFADLQLATR